MFMKTKLSILAMLLFSSTMFLSSCSKEEEDGKVVFWNKTGDGIGLVVVQVEQSIVGSITLDYADAPDCGANGVVTYTDKPGLYIYSAAESSPGSRTWSGSFTLTDGGCFTLRFTP